MKIREGQLALDFTATDIEGRVHKKLPLLHLNNKLLKEEVWAILFINNQFFL